MTFNVVQQRETS